MLSLLLFISITLAIVALTALLINPAIGLLVLIVVKPIIDTSFYSPLLFGMPLTQIVAVLVPMIVMWHMLTANGSRRLRMMPLRTIWIVYAADIFFFSLIIIYNQGIMDGLNVFFRHINGFIGFYLIQAFRHEDRKLKSLLVTYLIAGIFPALTSTYQIFTGTVWHHLGHLQVEGLTRFAGLYYDVFTVRYYALQTIVALLLFTSLYAPRNIVLGLGAMFYGLASLFIIFKAYTKSGFVTLAIWSFLWTTLQKKFIALAVITTLILFALPFYAGDIVDSIQTVFRKEIGALEGKLAIQQTFEGRWFGWGELLSRWQGMSFLAMAFGSGHVMTGAHNDYIQILYHGGVVGLVIYVTLLGTIGANVIKSVMERAEPLRVAALMLYLMYLIDTIGLVPSAYPGYQWLVWGLVGLSLRRRQEMAREQQVAGRNAAPSASRR